MLITEKLRREYRPADGLMTAWGWAVDTFGTPSVSRQGNPRWSFDAKLTFYFRDEADAVLFALRWT